MFKDITITSGQLTRELLIILGCFLVAFGVNVYSVIRFSTPWTEIFTQIGYILIITAVFYIICVIIRLVVWALRQIIRRCRA